MATTQVSMLFKQMQYAMQNPDELIWWMAQLESYHALVELTSTEVWEQATSHSPLSWRGWKETGHAELKGVVSYVGVDFETRSGFYDRTFYMVLIVPGKRYLQKVYLNRLTALKELPQQI